MLISAKYPYCGIDFAVDKAEFINNIIWDDKASILSGIVYVSYSDLDGGWGYMHNGYAVYGEGNIDADPLFVSMENDDFHLTKVSPCINMGTNEVAEYYSMDFEGDDRIIMGTADMGADEFVGPHSLGADSFTLSEAVGGKIALNLDAGLSNGGRNYMLFGTVSGTAPGLDLPGGDLFLPINWDLFTNIVADLNYPRSIIFKDFYGKMDNAGKMNALFNTNGPVPGMKGYVVSFAYSLHGAPWDYVSNPINIEIVP